MQNSFVYHFVTRSKVHLYLGQNINRFSNYNTDSKNDTTRRTRKVSTPGSVFLHYEAYSWAGQIMQTKSSLFYYCPTQPKYRQLKTAQIYNVNFKAIWWIFFKSSSDNMLNSINDFRFISVLQWYLKVLRHFEVKFSHI